MAWTLPEPLRVGFVLVVCRILQENNALFVKCKEKYQGFWEAKAKDLPIAHDKKCINNQHLITNSNAKNMNK
jgi:hypothetical protein